MATWEMKRLDDGEKITVLQMAVDERTGQLLRTVQED